MTVSGAQTRTGAPVRVLVVDDSVVIRRLVTDVLQDHPDIEVVGTAVNGRYALAKIEQLSPDLVTLDIEMPELDGIATLKQLRQTDRRLPVIMFSTLTERGAASTLEALGAGASDYVTKPANMGSIAESMASVRDQLIPKIFALTGHPAAHRLRPPATTPPRRVDVTAPASRRTPRTAPRIVAIGCSTGGPQALATVLTSLPADYPLPVVVVQHMPPVFTAQFAARLDRLCQVRVHEATDGQALEPGHVYLAPGDFHLELRTLKGRVVTRLHQGPQVAFCRPSVDVLFTSVAAVYGPDVQSVVLTGMGQDGRDGCATIRERGGGVVVQDEATSVVWGMPGAVATAGLADQVIPLPEIGPTVVRLTMSSGTRVALKAGS